MSELNALAELFRAHDVRCDAGIEWITFPDQNMRAGARVVRERTQASGLSAQLDISLEIARGRTIVESFVGVGQTRDNAIADALNNFAINSFHVFLAAFFNPDDDQVSREEWLIGGRKTLVTLGNVGVRGKPPVQGDQLLTWFKHFEQTLKQKRLDPGTHWIRLYYGQMNGKAMACEVLLDNDIWKPVQLEMAAFNWPMGEAFYSVRIFMIIAVS